MGSQPPITGNTIRFGNGFELDIQIGRLYRDGRAMRVERIPIEILAFLIDRKGQLVTRDQIVERIWGKNVFLDSDNGINGAIRKIRQVLRDDPANPTFIQTISGKGYRFIAPVANATLVEEIAETVPDVAPVELEAVAAGGARKWWPFGVIAGVLLASAAVYLWRPTQPGPTASGRVMLAVLPFDNLTGDSSQDYFSDGLTEEMITQLGNLNPERLGVIARTSVMHYRQAPTALAQIVRELGVQYVIEGSVRRDGPMLRITAQLIQASDETHVWAREYDRELKDVLAVQGEIAQQIAHETAPLIGGGTLPVRAAAQPVLSPAEYEAYDAYLKGLYFFNKRDVGSFEQATRYFEQAIKSDPQYARAYAGLADSLMLMSAYSLTRQDEVAEPARSAALHALELDSSLPEAHTALALVVEDYDWDWNAAEREFRQAIELNPNYATAHHWYAEHLTWRGRFDEALQEIDKAQQLDPLSLIIAADKAAIHYYARQYDQAIHEFQAVLELEPNFPRAQLIASAYVEKGRLADALAIVEKQRESEGPVWYWSNLAYLYGRAGKFAEARHAVDELTRLSHDQTMDPAVFVWAYAAMGDKDHAFKWLDRAYAEHSNAMTGLKVGPGYDRLRDDPRFTDVLRRVGLAE